jgi:hypothetical protein
MKATHCGNGHTAYVVRVMVPADKLYWFDNTPWLECLRYAGCVKIRKPADNSGNGMIFDLRPPASVGTSREWARQNARRIRSFGLETLVVHLRKDADFAVSGD